MTFKPGDDVTYLNYGTERKGVVSQTSRDGSLVFIRKPNGALTWCHALSVTHAPKGETDV